MLYIWVCNFQLDVLIIFLVAQAAQVNFVVGSHAWVEDPQEAWIDGEVVDINDAEIKINCTSGKTVSAASEPFL